jgi:hypothetical protein
MKPTLTIDIAKQFSTEPAGRYEADGSSSGEVFRRKHLAPALDAYDQVTVILDGTEGYGSSFLEEAFGGLVRLHGVTDEQFRHRVKLVSDEDPSLLDEIYGYVAEEQSRLRASSPSSLARSPR